MPDKIDLNLVLERMMQAMRIPNYKELLIGDQPDPMGEQMAMLEMAERQAKIDKLKADTTVRNGEGQFSAVQTAKEIVMNPAIVPVSDELLLSAGYQDANGAPLANVPQIPPEQMTPVVQNTDPRFPANPASPGVGQLQGMETTANDSGVM